MELGCPPHPGGESLTIVAAAQHLQILFADLVAADRKEYRDKLKRANKTKQTASEQNDDDLKGRVSYHVLRKKEAEIEEILENMSRSTSSTKSLTAWLCILKAELEQHEHLRRRVYKTGEREKSSFGKTLLELEGSLIAGLKHRKKEKEMKKAATKSQSASKDGSNLMDELNEKLTRRNSSSQLSYEELVAHFSKNKRRKSSEEDDGCKSDDQPVDTFSVVDKEEEVNPQPESDGSCDESKRDDQPEDTLNVVDKEEEVDRQSESDRSDGSCDESNRDDQPKDTLNVVDKEEEVDPQLDSNGSVTSSSSEVVENEQVVGVDSEMGKNHHESHVLEEPKEEILIGQNRDQANPLPDQQKKDTPLSLVENPTLFAQPITNPDDDCGSISPTRSLCDDDLRRCSSFEDMFDGKSTSSLSTTWTVGGPVGYGVEYVRMPVFSGSYYEYEKEVAAYEEAVARIRREQMQQQKKKALVNVYRLQLQALESECSKEYRKIQEMQLELEPLRQIIDTWNILQDDSLDFLCIPTPASIFPPHDNGSEEKFLVTSQVGQYPNKRNPAFQVSTLTGTS